MTQDPIQLLKQGGIGVLATDTLYGLVACALNKVAVERVYAVKRRTPSKPVIMLVADASDVTQFGVSVDSVTAKVLGHVWPGPVSVVLACQNSAFEYLHRGTSTLAFRVPASESLRALLRQTGPLIASSANPEGQPPAQTIAEAHAYFGDTVDFYGTQTKGEDVRLDGAPSTLIQIKSGKVTVLRQGSAEIPHEWL